MRIAITGATGNVGTSVLAALADAPEVEEIVAIARRPATLPDPRVRFHVADVSLDDLVTPLQGVDAVIHLAWLIQPSRDEAITRATNVDGTRRLLEAAALAGVRAVVHASSVGAYSPGPKDRRVDETWPTGGIATSFYSRHKAEAERLLDAFELERPDVRVARLRPGLIFKRDAASGIRRLFAGPLLPPALVRRSLIPVVPDVPRLRFQAVHSLDVGDAYRRALLADDAHGAFNVAAEPVLDPAALAELLGAKRVPLRGGMLRAAADLSWRARLQPSPPGWIDLALGVPLLDTTRDSRAARLAAAAVGRRGAAGAARRDPRAGRRADPPLAPDGELLRSTALGAGVQAGAGAATGRPPGRARGAPGAARSGGQAEIASTSSPTWSSSTLRATSAWATIPTSRLPSITGRRRTWCRAIVCSTSETGSSAPIVTVLPSPAPSSPARVEAGSFPCASTFTTMSRSVSIPSGGRPRRRSAGRRRPARQAVWRRRARCRSRRCRCSRRT